MVSRQYPQRKRFLDLPQQNLRFKMLAASGLGGNACRISSSRGHDARKNNRRRLAASTTQWCLHRTQWCNDPVSNDRSSSKRKGFGVQITDSSLVRLITALWNDTVACIERLKGVANGHIAHERERGRVCGPRRSRKLDDAQTLKTRTRTCRG